ncbi:MAG TPA: SPOR domain-containing protein [Telluria sp.]|nr:SPOR domain-containing protein [Telluria sp.]
MGFSSSDQNKQEPGLDDDAGHFFKADDAEIAAGAKSKRASSAGEGAPRRARKSEAADPMLPEKKRARRRLVGAIALALAVAVGLPMILESEPKPLNDIAIQIPSKDNVPPLPVPAAVPAAAPAAAETSPDVATLDASAGLGEGEELVTLPPPAPAKPEVQEPARAEPKPAAKPVEPVAKAAEKPAAKPADDAARALAILEGKANAEKASAARAAAEKAKPDAAAGQKFVVQAGAFESPEKIAELRARLSRAGFESYTEKTPKATRVRIGPFATRAAADQAHAKLQKAGISSSVVAG